MFKDMSIIQLERVIHNMTSSRIKCQRCNIEKEKTEMHSGAVYRKCKECIILIVQEKIESGEEKACPVCYESKTWDHFWFGKDQCKECQLAKRKLQKEERKTDTSTRVCKTCKVEQPIQQFEVRRANCKECVKQAKQPYLKSTRVHRTEVTRKYRENHPEYVKKDLENTKEYNRIHRKEINAKENHRKKIDPAFKLTKHLRSSLLSALKGTRKHKSALKILGCDIDFLKKWFEHQFDANMSWENHGKYWHIDHITPIASCNMSNLEEIERCFHWSNMHPLEKTENMKKSNKIIPELIDKKQKMAEEFKKSYIQ